MVCSNFLPPNITLTCPCSHNFKEVVFIGGCIIKVPPVLFYRLMFLRCIFNGYEILTKQVEKLYNVAVLCYLWQFHYNCDKPYTCVVHNFKAASDQSHVA